MHFSRIICLKNDELPLFHTATCTNFASLAFEKEAGGRSRGHVWVRIFDELLTDPFSVLAMSGCAYSAPSSLTRSRPWACVVEITKIDPPADLWSY